MYAGLSTTALGVIAFALIYRRLQRNIYMDVSALTGIARQQFQKSNLVIQNVAGQDMDPNVQIIMPRVNQLDQPNEPLGNYIRDKKFIAKNNNKRMPITVKNVTDFDYINQILHGTAADFRVSHPTSSTKLLDGLFSYKEFYTTVEYRSSRVHNVTNTDLRCDINSTGFVKHWETKIDEYEVTKHFIGCRNPTIVGYLERFVPKSMKLQFFKLLYDLNIEFDIRNHVETIFVSSELLQNVSSLKTLNPRHDVATTKNIIDVAISNSSSVNIPRTFTSDLQHIYSDTAELALHLFNEKVFRTSHLMSRDFQL